jgi:hypothetical protein
VPLLEEVTIALSSFESCNEVLKLFTFSGALIPHFVIGTAAHRDVV